MTLTLNRSLAEQADSITSGIKESGKYVGVITRAEKLVSQKGTEGLGLSFRADSGQVADYLDIYHTNGSGEALSGLKTVHAVLCCARVANAQDGKITVEKWDQNTRQRMKVVVDGYPALMGKRIGFLLQKTLETNAKTGADRESVVIFGVFDAETELTASETYARASKPEKLTLMLDSLMARPVRDNRTSKPAQQGSSQAAPSRGHADAEIPFDDAPF
jgi:hypothetical protein